MTTLFKEHDHRSSASIYPCMYDMLRAARVTGEMEGVTARLIGLERGDWHLVAVARVLLLWTINGSKAFHKLQSAIRGEPRSHNGHPFIRQRIRGPGWQGWHAWKADESTKSNFETSVAAAGQPAHWSTGPGDALVCKVLSRLLLTTRSVNTAKVFA